MAIHGLPCPNLLTAAGVAARGSVPQDGDKATHLLCLQGRA